MTINIADKFGLLQVAARRTAYPATAPMPSPPPFIAAGQPFLVAANDDEISVRKRA